MLCQVVKNCTIKSCRHGGFPLAKMEGLFARVFLGSPNFWLRRGLYSDSRIDGQCCARSFLYIISCSIQFSSYPNKITILSGQTDRPIEIGRRYRSQLAGDILIGGRHQSQLEGDILMCGRHRSRLAGDILYYRKSISLSRVVYPSAPIGKSIRVLGQTLLLQRDRKQSFFTK